MVQLQMLMTKIKSIKSLAHIGIINHIFDITKPTLFIYLFKHTKVHIGKKRIKLEMYRKLHL